MKQLLEDYQRKLKTIQNAIDNGKFPKKSEIQIRYETKASCYRTFISELEREINQQEKG